MKDPVKLVTGFYATKGILDIIIGLFAGVGCHAFCQLP